jgi:hypothetical protein
MHRLVSFPSSLLFFDYNYHDLHVPRMVLIQHPSYHEYQTIAAGMKRHLVWQGSWV